MLARILLTLLLTLVAMAASGRDNAPLPDEAYLGSTAGARHMAMGKALTGTGEDGNSLYWNPAGLNLLPVGFLSMTFSSQPLTGFGQLINPTLRGRGLSSIALSTSQVALAWRTLSQYSIDDSVWTEGDTVEVQTDLEYGVDEYVLAITTMAGRKELPSEQTLLLGVNLKYLRGELGIAETRKMNRFSQEPVVNLDRGNGYGIDLGALLNWKRLAIGFSVQNLLTKLYWRDYEARRVEATLLGGGSIRPFEWLTLTGSMQRRWRRDVSTVFHLGGEAFFRREKQPHWYGFLTSFSPSIRLGVYGADLSKREEMVFTGGLGYIYSRYKLDTGVYGKEMDDLGYVVTLSLPF